MPCALTGGVSRLKNRGRSSATCLTTWLLPSYGILFRAQRAGSALPGGAKSSRPTAGGPAQRNHCGALSVWVQSCARPRMEFIVGPGAFSPPPKVDSAVLSFDPLPPERRPAHPEILALARARCINNSAANNRRRFQAAATARLRSRWKRQALTQACALKPSPIKIFRLLPLFGAEQFDNNV